MLAAQLYAHRCTIYYRSDGPVDEHNDPTDVWTSVDTVCQIQERSRLQNPGDGQIGVSMWLVYFKPTETIPGPADALEVDGVEYFFHGDGWLAHDSYNLPDHIETTCWRAA